METADDNDSRTIRSVFAEKEASYLGGGPPPRLGDAHLQKPSAADAAPDAPPSHALIAARLIASFRAQQCKCDERSAREKRQRQRLDIQGLRAVAMLAVLLYHLWPTYTPAGFLGVDVFFVLSGYLIAHCLAPVWLVPLHTFTFRSVSLVERFNASLIADFYFRRVRRIVPIFGAVVLATVCVARAMFLPDDWDELRWDAVWALTFTKNLHSYVVASAGYFTQLRSYDAFVHSWSLAVEMQFYVLAPVLCLLALALATLLTWFATTSFRGDEEARTDSAIRQTNFFRAFFLLLLLGVVGASLLAQTFVVALPEALAFGLVFGRLWQFLAGAFAFYVYEQRKRRAHNNLQRLRTQIHVRDDADDAAGMKPDDEAKQGVAGPGSRAKMGDEAHNIGNTATTTNERTPSSSIFQFARPWLLALFACACLFGLLVALFEPRARVRPTTASQVSRRALVTLFTALFLAANDKTTSATTKTTPPNRSVCNALKAFEPVALVLTNRVAVRVGDLSYALYLVHWPTIVLIRYHFNVVAFGIIDGLIAIAISALLALAFEQLCDARFQRIKSPKRLIALIVVLYAAIGVQLSPSLMERPIGGLVERRYDGRLDAFSLAQMIQRANPLGFEMARALIEHRYRRHSADYFVGRSGNGGDNSTTIGAESGESVLLPLNEQLLADKRVVYNMNRLSRETVPEYVNTQVTSAIGSVPKLQHYIEHWAQGEGSANVMLVGNSHAQFSWTTYLSALRKYARTLHSFTIRYCMALPLPDDLFAEEEGTNWNCDCVDYVRAVLEMARINRPDAIIFHFKWDPVVYPEPLSAKGRPMHEDRIVSLWQRFVDELHRHTKHVFIIGPYPRFPVSIASEVAKRVGQDVDPATLAALHASYSAHEAEVRNTEARLNALQFARENASCTIVDYARLLCDRARDVCFAFDERTLLAYYYDVNHPNYVYHQLMYPVMQQQIGERLARIN